MICIPHLQRRIQPRATFHGYHDGGGIKETIVRLSGNFEEACFGGGVRDNLQGGRMGQLVCLSQYKIIEGKGGIDLVVPLAGFLLGFGGCYR